MKNVLVFLVTPLLCATWATSVRAESAPLYCAGDISLTAVPADLQTVPANLPALAIRPIYAPDWQLDTIELSDSANNQVALTTVADPTTALNSLPFQLALISGPLTEGEVYTIHWTGRCDKDGLPKSSKGTNTFTAGPAIAGTWGLGTAALSPSQKSVVVTPSAEALAFLPVAGFALSTEEGATKYFTPYGSQVGPTVELPLSLPCQSPGPTQTIVTVYMHVAGASTDPEPVSLTADYVCPAIIDSGADAPATIDSGADAPATIDSGADAPATIDSGADAPAVIDSGGDAPAIVDSSDGVAVPAAGSSDSGCGCSQVPRRSGWGLCSLLVVAAAAIARKKRASQQRLATG